MDAAVQTCKTYVAAAMDFINANAYAGTKLKIISNLYYPGYAADNVQSSCKDAATDLSSTCRTRSCRGSRSELLDVRVRPAEGLPVRRQLRPVHGRRLRQERPTGRSTQKRSASLPGESETAYVTRITSTLRSTIRDSNSHFVSSSSSYDYIQSDDTHPTYSGGTVRAGLLGGTSGSSDGRYSSFINGKNPIWNQYGHERTGWALSTFTPPTP
jgi:hypothetical protein